MLPLFVGSMIGISTLLFTSGAAIPVDTLVMLKQEKFYGESLQALFAT
jgi:hypothetical protein